MTQITLRDLAKQGDTKAIASLLNSFLQPKGIKAKVNLKDDCLDIFLESEQTLDKQKISAWLHKTSLNLNIDSIKSVNVYGKTNSENWHQTIELNKNINTCSSQQKYINRNLTTPKPNRKKLLIASIAVFILGGSIVGTVFWLRNLQIKTLVEAQNLASNIEANNQVDLELLKTNQAQLEQVIKVLDKAPNLPIPGLLTSQIETEKTKIFTRWKTEKQHLKKLELLHAEITAIIDQFSALDSRLDVGMSYREYSSTISDLKVALDRFFRQSEATSHPTYISLKDTFNQYDFALNVWRNYIESDDYSKFFPASSDYGTVLVSKYQVEINKILGEEYIYLNTALAKVWSMAKENVEAAQKQLTSRQCLSNCTSSLTYRENSAWGQREPLRRAEFRMQNLELRTQKNFTLH